MTQLLRQVSVGTKFAAQFAGVAALTTLSAAGLALTGAVKLELAHPQVVAACLAVTGLVGGAWSWWVGRSAARPLKDVLQLVERMSEAAGPVPFAIDRGDEAAKLLRHLSHVQEQQQALVRSYNELKDEQDDQQDEMAQWATDTLRLRTALDSTHIDALITDEQGVILFVTRSLAVMLKEHQAKIKAVLPQVDLDRLVGQRLEAFSQAADGADLTILPTSDVETELRFAGLTFALRAQAVVDRKAQVAGHVVIWRDLSAALETASNEVDAEPLTHVANPELDQVKRVLDLSIVPSYVADLKGQVCMANQALKVVLLQCESAFKAANSSFDANHVVGRSVGAFFGDPAAAIAQLQALSQRETSRKVLGGRTYDVTHTPVLDDQGQVVAVLGQWVDCTAQWLAERSFAALAQRVSQGDYSRPAALEGMDGLHRQIGEQLNAVVHAMYETIAPVRHATEQLGNALAQVSQSTLTLQETIQALASKGELSRVAKPNAMLAEKAGALLAQMVPAINHTTELLQDPMNPQASEALAATAEELQAQAALLQAMVASYRLAVGSNKVRSLDERKESLAAA